MRNDTDAISTPAQCPSYLLSGTRTNTENTQLCFPFLSSLFPRTQEYKKYEKAGSQCDYMWTPQLAQHYHSAVTFSGSCVTDISVTVGCSLWPG